MHSYPEIAALVSFGGYDGVRDRGDCSISRHPQFLIERSGSKDHLLGAGKPPVAPSPNDQTTAASIILITVRIATCNTQLPCSASISRTIRLKCKREKTVAISHERGTRGVEKAAAKSETSEEQLRVELEDDGRCECSWRMSWRGKARVIVEEWVGVVAH